MNRADFLDDFLNNFWLDQHRIMYLWILNASQLQLYLLDPGPAVARRILWNRVCLFIFPSLHLLGCYFSEFWRGTRNPDDVHDSPIFWKNVICPKNWGNGPKVIFFEFKEKLSLWFSLNLCKIYYKINAKFIICCIPTQILYLG